MWEDTSVPWMPTKLYAINADCLAGFTGTYDALESPPAHPGTVTNNSSNCFASGTAHDHEVRVIVESFCTISTPLSVVFAATPYSLAEPLAL